MNNSEVDNSEVDNPKPVTKEYVLGDNKLSFTIHNSYAILTINNIDFPTIKAFLLLLVFSKKQLTKIGVKHIQHYVELLESTLLVKTGKWEILEKTEYCLLQCSIEDYIDNITKALEINC